MLNFGKRKSRNMEEFIPREGMEIKFFEQNCQRYFGPDVRWEIMVNALNGSEGFVVTSSESISPDAVRRMRADASESRRKERLEADRVYFEEHYKSELQQRGRPETPVFGDDSVPIFNFPSEYNTDANMSQAPLPYPDSQHPIHREFSMSGSPAVPPPPAYEEACYPPFNDEPAVFPATPANYDYFCSIDEANRLDPHVRCRSSSGSDYLSLRGARSAIELRTTLTRPMPQGFLDASGCFFVPR